MPQVEPVIYIFSPDPVAFQAPISEKTEFWFSWGQESRRGKKEKKGRVNCSGRYSDLQARMRG